MSSATIRASIFDIGAFDLIRRLWLNLRRRMGSGVGALLLGEALLNLNAIEMSTQTTSTLRTSVADGKGDGGRDICIRLQSIVSVI